MKILDSNFRKELYKNLIEAGYDKAEAQKIVGAKYFNALKENVMNSLTTLVNNTSEDNFVTLNEEWLASYNNDISELVKMKEYV